MERKKRGYKRLVEKKRDYRLFAIACEGSVRERDYFECFEVLSSRISVDLIADVDEEGNVVVTHNSSPEHVLQRAQIYADNTDLVDGDQMEQFTSIEEMKAFIAKGENNSKKIMLT